MSYTIQYKSESIDNLEQLIQEASPSVNRQIQSRIIKKIIWLAENFDNITPLALSANLAGMYKLRVGDYRIIYEFNDMDETITILKIGHRNEIYG
jgi:mRNA interferase RelE/StbE